FATKIALAPDIELVLESRHQARDRVLGKRRAAQQRRQRSLDPPGVRAGHVNTQNRFVYAARTPLVTRDDLARPLPRRTVFLVHAGSRHLDQCLAQARRELPWPRAVAVTESLLTDTGRSAGSERSLQFFFHDH